MNTLHLCYVILRSITEQKHQSFILEALKITILSWIQVLAVYFATSAICMFMVVLWAPIPSIGHWGWKPCRRCVYSGGYVPNIAKAICTTLILLPYAHITDKSNQPCGSVTQSVGATTSCFRRWNSKGRWFEWPRRAHKAKGLAWDT